MNTNRRHFFKTVGLGAVGMLSTTSGASQVKEGGKHVLYDGQPSFRKLREEAKITDKVLLSFEGLRVTDVHDGLDQVGLRDQFMDTDIRPIFPGITICGRALTSRYIQSSETVPMVTRDKYRNEFMKKWARNKVGYPAFKFAKPGDILVTDCSDTKVGLWGSNVSLSAAKLGILGYITNGATRDVNELRIQNTPVFCKYIAVPRTMGRLEHAESNVTITCGGVKVSPGDIIVADDDGIVVVPAGVAEEVASIGREYLKEDIGQRRAKYIQLGMPLDDTVQL